MFLRSALVWRLQLCYCSILRWDVFENQYSSKAGGLQVSRVTSVCMALYLFSLLSSIRIVVYPHMVTHSHSVRDISAVPDPSLSNSWKDLNIASSLTKQQMKLSKSIISFSA